MTPAKPDESKRRKQAKVAKKSVKKKRSAATHADKLGGGAGEAPNAPQSTSGKRTAAKPDTLRLSQLKPRSKTSAKRTPQTGKPVRRASEFGEPKKLPQKTVAVIVQAKGAEKGKLLESALEQSGFWPGLEAARKLASLALEKFQIIIKPDFGHFDQAASTGTDPELVEHLIDLLIERGYSHVAIGDGRNTFDMWLVNRDVLVLAEMIGYKFVTKLGHDYDVVDLSEDQVTVAYPNGSALTGTGLSRTWVEANYRISFAKNKTDEEDFYALGLRNLMGVLPLRDKDYHYRHRLKPWDVCVELLKQTPVHFSLIDAFVSNHGSAGSRHPRPLKTNTIIASPDLLLSDWAAAIKMGVDPFASQLNGRALREIGLPVAYKIVGDQSPYEDWINVHPLVADSVRRRNEWSGLSHAVRPWLQRVNTELFPFKDPVNERVNALASRYLSNVDDNPAAFWANVGLNYWFGAVHKSLEAMRTLYQKDRLRWIEAPVNIELSDYAISDYEAIVAYLEPLAEQISQDKVDKNNLRWRYLGGSVVFEFSRTIPAPYDDFVARVDISKAIEFMNDYIGGVAVPIALDKNERVTHQVERNLYLTQPNYLVLYDGKVIDVTKLEYIIYSADQQKIYWKTVKSENGSATFDDGIVTFARTSSGETHVSVFGRQQFTLPLFWQVVNLDLNPLLKDFLVTHAYTTFFTQTLANFEARYEGREIRIGRPWNPLENEPEFDGSVKTPADRLSEFVEKVNRAGEVVNQHVGGIIKKLPWTPKPSPTAAATHTDKEGFAHFKPTPEQVGDNSTRDVDPKSPGMLDSLRKAGVEALGLINDFNKAAQKDWGTFKDDD